MMWLKIWKSKRRIKNNEKGSKAESINTKKRGRTQQVT